MRPDTSPWECESILAYPAPYAFGHLYSNISLGSSDSNEAVNVSLVAPGTEGLKTLHSFHPKMTYSVFGDEERIFGYQGLNINLRFNASDMRPGLQIIYNKKFKDVGETKPTDLKAILENYLPKSKLS